MSPSAEHGDQSHTQKQAVNALEVTAAGSAAASQACLPPWSQDPGLHLLRQSAKRLPQKALLTWVRLCCQREHNLRFQTWTTDEISSFQIGNGAQIWSL